jgi:predicted O-methyltransferase YrrM
MSSTESEFILDRLTQSIPDRFFADPPLLAIFQELRRWRIEKLPGEMDPVRISQFVELLSSVTNLPRGDYAELGTQHGYSAKVIWTLMNANADLLLFDTFAGFTAHDIKREKQLYDNNWTTESIVCSAKEQVAQVVCGQTAHERLVLIEGRVPETFAGHENRRFRFAHLDMDLYEPTRTAIPWLWSRMVPGGIMVFHDYGCAGFPGVKKAVDKFFGPLGIPRLPMGDRWGSAMVVKQKSKSLSAHIKTLFDGSDT